MHEDLIKAIEKLLSALDIDGTCQVCEMSYYFHANSCPVKDVNNHLNRIER
jgi:hypothetical protein